MPLGSSSAAPVTSPGPSLDRNDLRSLSAMRRPPEWLRLLAILFVRSLEALGDDIPLARILAAGRRLGVLHRGEAALQLGNQAVVGSAGEHLGNKVAAGPKHF